MCITVKRSRSTYALLPSRIFLIMEGALVSETVPCPSRFESPWVRARLCRWGARVWDLICGFCDVCTYAHAHGEWRWCGARVNGPKTHLEKEWVSKESLVRAAGGHCDVTCATNACTAAVGRETNDFCRRETVRARHYFGRQRLKVRLDHCQIATRRLSRWSRDLKYHDPYLVKMVYLSSRE